MSSPQLPGKGTGLGDWPCLQYYRNIPLKIFQRKALKADAHLRKISLHSSVFSLIILKFSIFCSSCFPIKICQMARNYPCGYWKLQRYNAQQERSRERMSPHLIAWSGWNKCQPQLHDHWLTHSLSPRDSYWSLLLLETLSSFPMRQKGVALGPEQSWERCWSEAALLVKPPQSLKTPQVSKLQLLAEPCLEATDLWMWLSLLSPACSEKASPLCPDWVLPNRRGGDTAFANLGLHLR